MKKKILSVIIIIVAILVLIHTCGKKKIYNEIISTVKDGYFYEITQEATVGEIMETICTDSKWEYTPNTDGGLVFVTYTGNMKGQPVKMMFLINNFGGTMRFQLNYFSLNGEEADNGYGKTGKDELSMIPFVLYKVYKEVKGK